MINPKNPSKKTNIDKNTTKNNGVIGMMDIFNIGIDVGSTTVKVVVLDKNKNIVFKQYKRHLSDIKKAVTEVLSDTYEVIGNKSVSIVITGSGGMNLANDLGVEFVQEVIASTKAIENYNPETAPTGEIFGYNETPGLNLITCTGSFNHETGNYEERLVVHAELNE